jgi:hypothetical protein
MLPVIVDLGCKKQARCGCGKDVLFELVNEEATVYFNSEFTNIQFSTTANPIKHTISATLVRMKKYFSESESGGCASDLGKGLLELQLYL